MGISAGIRDTATPADYADALAYSKAMDKTVRALANDGFWLDEYTGTDDDKLTAAISDQQGATSRNMPAIVLPCRPMTFTLPRSLYSGIKIVGSPNYSGQKNPDLAGGSHSGPEINLGGSISSGTSSWWNSPGADAQNVLMANFQVQGSQGGSVHQFLDFNSGGSMYPASFHSLSFNMMRGVFGRTDRKCLSTQITMTGDWTINNCWDTAINVGGSDMNIAPTMMNIGTSSSASQTGDINRYFIKIDTTEMTVAGKVYISTMNGWRGVLISGNSSVDWHGGVIEGFKGVRQTVGGVPNSLLAGPGPGTQVKITGGVVNFYGTKIGQGMDNPDASEDGLMEISGAAGGPATPPVEATTEVGLHGVQFYGQNMGTAKAIKHRGGRLYAAGITRRTSEIGVWSGRPKVNTTATTNAGAYSFSNPDQSLTAV